MDGVGWGVEKAERQDWSMDNWFDRSLHDDGYIGGRTRQDISSDL